MHLLNGFFKNGLAIDLGTVNTVVFSPTEGVVLSEPSILALNKYNREVVSVGSQALKLLGREPNDIEVHRPIRRGAIDDFEIIEHETVLSAAGDNRDSLIQSALANFVQRHPGIEKGQVGVGVTGQQSFARFIKLPPVEKKKIPAGKDQIIETEQLNVLTDDGLQSIGLDQVRRLRFSKPELEQEFRKALEVLATAHDGQADGDALRCLQSARHRRTIRD